MVIMEPKKDRVILDLLAFCLKSLMFFRFMFLACPVLATLIILSLYAGLLSF